MERRELEDIRKGGGRRGHRTKAKRKESLPKIWRSEEGVAKGKQQQRGKLANDIQASGTQLCRGVCLDAAGRD